MIIYARNATNRHELKSAIDYHHVRVSELLYIGLFSNIDHANYLYKYLCMCQQVNFKYSSTAKSFYNQNLLAGPDL